MRRVFGLWKSLRLGLSAWKGLSVSSEASCFFVRWNHSTFCKLLYHATHGAQISLDICLQTGKCCASQRRGVAWRGIVASPATAARLLDCPLCSAVTGKHGAERWRWSAKWRWRDGFSGGCPVWMRAIWGFPSIGVPQNRWFLLENPIKMDDLEVPLFQESPIEVRSTNITIFHELAKSSCADVEKRAFSSVLQARMAGRLAEPSLQESPSPSPLLHQWVVCFHPKGGGTQDESSFRLGKIPQWISQCF